LFTLREQITIMNENQIITTTLEQLAKNTKFIGQFQHHLKLDKEGYDGELQFRTPDNLPAFNVEIKKEIRQYQIPTLLKRAEQHQPFMIMAETIFPLVKEELRANKINYVDAAGNIFIHFKNQMIWIDGNKPAVTKKTATNRAFTKTGLKALFYLLINEKAINYPYRKLADVTGIAVGNIKNIIDGLNQAGFILPLTKKQIVFQNKRELLERWITAYGEILRPAIFQQAYNFLDKTKFENWQKLEFQRGTTAWGGEPAGELLTGYLKPEILMLYTNERNKLARDWTLIPNEQGILKTYDKFWKADELDGNIYVHPLLVYADLMLTNDPRCIETAKIIYDKHLKNEFE